MKNIKNYIGLLALLGGITIVLVQCTGNDTPSAETSHSTTNESEIPVLATSNGIKQSCVLDATDFASWFASGSVSKNGLVNPANSLAVLNDNCDFYKWSWQNFLWQTSPADGSWVFDSPPFFDLEGSDLVIDGANKSVRGGKVESVGQAGLINGVLMSQTAGITPEGSLVYYAIHVNEAYAYFASGKNSGQLTDLTKFPTTKEEMAAITAYAKATYGVDIQNEEALTMELKSSWVRADPSQDLSAFITITSDVPHYDKVSETEWTWDGTTVDTAVTLAMVGYHLVGSTADHPEMIWATFEHKQNAPDFNYYYIDSNDSVQEDTVFGADGLPVEKNWLFNDGTTKLNASNQMHMETSGKDIVAQGRNTISASSTARTHPWGNTPDAVNAQNNTDIISLNTNIQSLLSAGDVRANYYLVGATWTANGVPGVGDQIPDVRGSKALANATMETYFQYKNCFSCHRGGDLDGLSHIFDVITPLPKK